MSMQDVIQRLHEIGPTIDKLLEVSTAAGASVGVLHHGEVIFTQSYGYRDLARKIVADEDTVYHIASLTKSFTAAALNVAADEGRFDWTQPLSSILPNFAQDNHEVARKATVLDLLAHRTGLASKNDLWLQDGPELLVDKQDLLSTFGYLETIHPFRSAWNYNNYGYALASVVLETVEGKSWGKVLQDRIIEPLNMTRTFTEPQPTLENQAMGYIAISDGTLVSVGNPAPANNTIMQGAAGVRSSVKDLLIYYRAVLNASKRPQNDDHTQEDSYKEPVFGDVQQLFTPHIQLDPENPNAGFYGAGWILAELPAPLGHVGTNGFYVDDMPLVGKGTSKRRIWYHHGNLVGFFSSVHLLPDTDTAIVVLVNSLARNDCADWIGQLLVETVLDNADKNDYIALAMQSAAKYEFLWAEVEAGRERHRAPKRNAKPALEYTGKYYNKPRTWYIDVVATEDDLEFRFQGRDAQRHRLVFLGGDRFAWTLSEKESASLGRWPDLDPAIYVFQFEEGDDGHLRHLRWHHDYDVAFGEVFTRFDGL